MVWCNPPCGSNQICQIASCGDAVGKCVAVTLTTTDAAYDPVCACTEGVTYWNRALAARRETDVIAPGACTGGHLCNRPGDAPCGSGTYCDAPFSDVAMCGNAAPAGVCIVLPKSCPNVGRAGMACDDQTTCSSACDLIQSGKPWVEPKPACMIP